MMKKLLISLGLAASLLGVAACSEGDDGDAGASPSEETTEQPESPGEEGGEQSESPEAGGTEQPEMPQPDLEGIPDVVAVVNGTDIPKDEFVPVYEGQFQQRAMQAQMSGEELDEDQLKAQTAEGMVGTELLTQEADNRELSASQGELDQALEEQAQASGIQSADDFLTALADQGMDEQEVMSQLETQVKVDKLVADEAGDTTPTEEELRERYDEVVAQQEQSGGEGGGGELPPFEEVRPQLEGQVESENESEVVQGLVSALREDADVTVNLTNDS